jgi:DNA-binding Lrp family transcriptional regulator
MDSLDIEVLKLLQKDGRKSYREIAGKLGVSTTTVTARVRRMLDAGVLKGFYPKFDYKRVGFEVDILVLWQARVSEIEGVEEFNTEMQLESFEPCEKQDVVVHYVWSGTIPPFTSGMICSARSPEVFRKWWYSKIKKYSGLIRHFNIVLILKKWVG